MSDRAPVAYQLNSISTEWVKHRKIWQNNDTISINRSRNGNATNPDFS